MKENWYFWSFKKSAPKKEARGGWEEWEENFSIITLSPYPPCLPKKGGRHHHGKIKTPTETGEKTERIEKRIAAPLPAANKPTTLALDFFESHY